MSSALDTNIVLIVICCLFLLGLGTSTAADAKEYFSRLDDHVITFEWDGDDDDKNIKLAFSKNLADARKQWLAGETAVCFDRVSYPYDDPAVCVLAFFV